MNKKNGLQTVKQHYFFKFMTCFVFSLLVTLSLTVQAAKNIYEFEVKDIDGKAVPMKTYKGKVLMIVNTASQCGYTPQLKDLVELQKKYGPQGFQVLAFPSNDFKQDRGSNADTKKFSQETYQINFPLFDKGHVVGASKEPVFEWIESSSKSIPKQIQWNFEKFLVNRNGELVERFRSDTSPTSKEVQALIEKLLQKN